MKGWSRLTGFLWLFLKRHRRHVLICVFLALLSSVIMAGSLSFTLPMICQFFGWKIAPLSSSSGFFAGILSFYDRHIGQRPDKHTIAISLMLVMAVVNAVMRFLIEWVNAGLTAKLTIDCRQQLYESIRRMCYQVFAQQERGYYIQYLVVESRSVYAVFKQLLYVTSTGINILVVFALLILLSWKLTAVLFVVYPLTAGVNVLLTRRVKKLGKEALRDRTALMARVTEAIRGFKQARLLRAEKRMAEQVHRASVCSALTARRLRVRQALLPMITKVLTSINLVVVLVLWLRWPVFTENIPKFAGLMLFVICIKRLASSVGEVAREYGSIHGNLPGLYRVHDFLSGRFEPERDGCACPEPLLSEAIKFSGVTFGYDPSQPVLKDVSLVIPRGSYVGIVGPSGGGKSTVFGLLTRLYDPDVGQITVDGVDLRDIRLDHLRSRIGLMSQDMFLFNGTVRDNLRMVKPDASDAELCESLRQAGLHTFIETQKDGLDVVVGDDGCELSGGQRQRLALAMLFLHDPEVIILDEATSAVDRETEGHILRSLRELRDAGKTIISSAHKESALVDADAVYCLDGGTLLPVSAT